MVASPYQLESVFSLEEVSSPEESFLSTRIISSCAKPAVYIYHSP
jgi:hypothetical protein